LTWKKIPPCGWRAKFSPSRKRAPARNFFTRINGRFALAPLALVLLLVETTDLLFAVDSVPAVFSVTRQAFIVFTSNVFAILGLRSMYFLLAGALGQFRHLKAGLSVVLVFIGVENAARPARRDPPKWFQVEIPTGRFAARRRRNLIDRHRAFRDRRMPGAKTMTTDCPERDHFKPRSFLFFQLRNPRNLALNEISLVARAAAAAARRTTGVAI
jgi:hypothetical protein